jgi:hypothetical protein
MVAASLLASLEADEVHVDRFWSAEAERRAQQLEAGEAELVTWDHVLEEVDTGRSHQR